MKIIGVGRAAEPCGPSFNKARPVFKEYFSIRTFIFPCFVSEAQIISLTTLWKGSLQRRTFLLKNKILFVEPETATKITLATATRLQKLILSSELRTQFKPNRNKIKLTRTIVVCLSTVPTTTDSGQSKCGTSVSPSGRENNNTNIFTYTYIYVVILYKGSEGTL